MLILLGWAVWAVVLVFAIGLTVTFPYKHLRTKPNLRYNAYATILLWIVLALFILKPNWSKFHILWILPVAFLILALTAYASGWVRGRKIEQ